MKKILFVSWQVGMGHITRDIAIVKELYRRNPGIDVSWLAHPLACKVLEQEGEAIHPQSIQSADYCLAATKCMNDFNLNVFKYISVSEKAWAKNVELFRKVISNQDFDLIIGDESYEILRALGDKRIELKTKMIVIEDFIGVQAMTKNPIEFLGVYLKNRRLASSPPKLASQVTRFFVGEMDDIPDKTYGLGLPNRREIANKYYNILGHVIRFNPADYTDKATVRKKLGYGKGPLIICATGGMFAGKELLELSAKAYSIVKKEIPGLRMISVCGELYGSKTPDIPKDIEMHSYIHNIYKHYAACDIAIVVGGGSTTIELTALRTPFIFFPLENQFDQQLYVAERIARHGAGIKMRYYETTPEILADAIIKNIGKEAAWPPINANGAEKAAILINQILTNVK